MRLALPLAVVLLVAPRYAAPEEPRFEEEIELRPGETRLVTTGPVRNVLCDQGGVAERVATEQGNGFRGLAPGETTCSLVTADGVKRLFHVKVVEGKR